jgi:hypothetical protein
MRLRLFALAAPLATALLAIQPAQAAPQILAALEVQEGMPLLCEDGRCETDITTFCLQQDRDAPRLGTAYVPAAADQFTLRLTGHDGSVRDMPATQASFTSGRGFTHVRVGVSEAQLAAWGARSARLVVTRQASLIPEPVAGDPTPLSKAEIHYVTTSLRPLGEEMVDGQPLAVAARIVGRIATAITDPRARPTASNVEGLWNGVLADMGDEATNGTALASARGEIDRCTRPGHHHSLAGVKSCLEYRHGDLMRNLNIDYWDGKPES